MAAAEAEGMAMVAAMVVAAVAAVAAAVVAMAARAAMALVTDEVAVKGMLDSQRIASTRI